MEVLFVVAKNMETNKMFHSGLDTMWYVHVEPHVSIKRKSLFVNIHPLFL